MKPACPKCSGPLVYKPADILGAESVTCRVCGWYLEKQPPVEAAVVIPQPDIHRVTLEEETAICNLRRKGGMTQPEIAVTLNVPLSAVKNVLQRNGIRKADTSVFAPKKTGTNSASPWRTVHLFPQHLPQKQAATGLKPLEPAVTDSKPVKPALTSPESRITSPENGGGGGTLPNPQKKRPRGQSGRGKTLLQVPDPRSQVPDFLRKS